MRPTWCYTTRVLRSDDEDLVDIKGERMVVVISDDVTFHHFEGR